VETGVNKNQGHESGADGLMADTDWWGECEGERNEDVGNLSSSSLL